MPLDETDRDLMRAVARYLKRIEALETSEQAAARTPLGDAVSEYLGADATALAVMTEEVAPHRLVDADIALDLMAREGGTVLGVGGGDQRFHSAIGELLGNPHTRFAPGPVTYATRATGPDSDRRVVAFGVRLLRVEGAPLAVLQRDAAPQYGRMNATLEVIAADEGVVPGFLRRLHELMVEHSVLRGQVLSFSGTEYGQQAGATFLARPEVPAADVVLADGVLESVVDHVVGIGEHRAELLEAGQHLKRGLLLYGPPGTGKTLTVRHLLTRTPGVTAVLLTGSSIQFIQAAAEIARTFQPSLVVLEDIDLVAMERSHSPQPLLFEVLDALDGLDGDADVAFVMTTNRVQVLERALAARPGRVDLGVEIPLPGEAARRRLFRRYAGSLPFSDAALDRAADRAEGTTGSFAKELMRRSILSAALRGATPDDDDLAGALDTLLSSGEALTRLLLGSGSGDTRPDDTGPDETGPDETGPDDADGHVVVAPGRYTSGSSAMSSRLEITDDPT
ncbi:MULTISPECIES: AAA family ATPase [unclassified Rathayibacter]|uniref:AAA family ATPase n=1 Tax=unclassified Rathayibacter TaxID=2609250 RepID=UPI000ACE9FA4|nr:MULTISPECIES: ATP-binding protein [unclassified Rathayibacter]